MIIDEDDFLEHFGVKGMRWGVRKDTPTGASRHVDKHAKKDAAEYARAKAFFGDGAGTRRKLINATVEGKSKRLPGYKQAFDHHLANEDPSRHASKAQSERSRLDRKEKNKQRGGALLRRVTGEPGTQAAIVTAVIGGGAFLASPQGRQLMSTAASTIANSSATKKAEKFVSGETMKRQRQAAKISDFINKST